MQAMYVALWSHNVSEKEPGSKATEIKQHFSTSLVLDQYTSGVLVTNHLCSMLSVGCPGRHSWDAPLQPTSFEHLNSEEINGRRR